jgi:hypothetical protein
MKALIAIAVLVAAATPAWAGSDTVSPTQALSRGRCLPTVIGTVISVHPDPAHLATDIVLGNILPPYAIRVWRPDGTIIALIRDDNVKSFPALNTYVGHKVAIWGGTSIIVPGQLQLLSAALAAPEKSWCYLSRFQRLNL